MGRPVARVRALALAFALTSTLGAGEARAEDPPAPEIAPMFQSSIADLAAGWNGVVVRLRAPSDRALDGQVRVVASSYVGGSREESVVMAPFAVPAGTSVALRVPFFVREFEQVAVDVLDAGERSLQATTLTGRAQAEVALLLDVSPASRFSEGVNGRAAARLSASGGRAVPVRLARPPFDYGSGDPILPDRPALYGGVSAALVRSDVLARLRGAELDALVGFVLSGGTLAVIVTRPDDLRGDALAAFVGGTPKPAAAPPEAGEAALQADDAGAPIGRSGGSSWGPLATSTGQPRVAPSDALRAALVGFEGGNLAPSAFGATATYGLGEVHLLAFDPTQASVATEPWVHARLVELTGRAWKLRGAAVTSGHGQDVPHDVLRTLDPNERSSSAVILSAILLLVYALLVGPLNFFLARRQGRPIAAFVRLPLFAAAAFLVVTGVGFATKGVRGRALHLAFVEAGAGMDTGSVRRYRGFYLARASDLTVRTSPGALAATLRAGFGRGKDEKLLVDRDGARLVDVQARPWQVVAIREEGTTRLGGGVSMIPDAAGFALVNRTGRTLRGVLVRLPKAGRAEAWLFDEVAPGATVRPGDGEPAPGGWATATDRVLTAPSGRSYHPLAGESLHFLDKKSKGLFEAWRAVEAELRTGDWFPSQTPVVLAEVVGGEGTPTDAGLAVERDRLLLRVVGWGGAP